jgi:phosphoglycolate phosphatase-like HAD superfamily hydrolase
MYTLPMFDTFLFALDGVLVDSAELIVSAFGELYAEHGAEARGMVEAYQRAHPGEARPERIAMFHRSLLGEELIGAELTAECDRLGQIILDEIADCPLMPDIAEALRVLRARGIATHIVSNAPQRELEAIVALKGLTGQFRSVHGAPRSREQICEAILNTRRIDRTRCLFVGNTMADYRCAASVGVHFLGIGAFATAPFPFGTIVTERLGDSFLDIATARLARPIVPAARPIGFGRRFRTV